MSEIAEGRLLCTLVQRIFAVLFLAIGEHLTGQLRRFCTVQLARAFFVQKKRFWAVKR